MFRPGDLCWHRDTGIRDTGLVVYVDTRAGDGYAYTVLWSDLSTDTHHQDQLGPFTAPRTAQGL